MLLPLHTHVAPAGPQHSWRHEPRRNSSAPGTGLSTEKAGDTLLGGRPPLAHGAAASCQGTPPLFDSLVGTGSSSR